ncbi:MAG: ABC transporter substrate-binding protein [Alphaproteobacteria bacterium]|nr:ABC transporter substrate-binding protein [Alphaproteobacteria bacterium]
MLAAALAGLPSARAAAEEAWEAVVAEARGQEVYWHAWGGDEAINDHIMWIAGQVADRYGVTLRHVKVSDTAQVVTQVLAEKAAGREAGGTVDLVWINGENFAAMKREGLLYGPFVERLPNYQLVDVENKPSITRDFTVPVDGLEAPWGMAQVVFMYDADRVPEPPRRITEFASWAAENPGRLAYPQPPDFLGSTFLKQALIALAAAPEALQEPVAEADFEQVTAPLWAWLDALHPHLWRKGRLFPQSGPAARQLLADAEIDIAISFNPGEASSQIAQGLLPDTVRTFVLEGGTLGNTHFVAIPFNANAKAGAMVVANFLMSPEAQLEKQNPDIWGDATVLALDKLSAEDRARFDAVPRGIATLSPDVLGPTLPEPHPSWVVRIEEEWKRRFER